MDISKQHDAWKTESPAYVAHPATPPLTTTAGPNAAFDAKPTVPAQYVVPMAIAVPLDAHNAYTHATPTTQVDMEPKTCGSRLLSWTCRLLLLLLFHVLNFALALTALTLAVTLVPLSIGLLPLCCIGVVVFRITAWVVEYLAIADIALANVVANENDEKLSVHPRIRSGRESPSRDDNDATHSSKRAIAWLQFVTPQNLGAMLYFATLKFATGVLSGVVVGCAVGLPVALVAICGVSNVQLYGLEYDDHPVAFVFSAIGATLLALVLLPVVAALSGKLTQFVCTESPSGNSPATPVSSFV